MAPVVKNPPVSSGGTSNVGLILGLRRSPKVENGTLYQYPCLENFIDRAAFQAIVHGVAKSQTQLSTHTHTHGALICLKTQHAVKSLGMSAVKEEKWLRTKPRAF